MYKAFFAVLIFILSSTPALAAKGDYVVLLHGIARTKSSMETLQKDFELHGYDVLNMDYPSRKYSIDKLAEYIHTDISTFNRDSKKKIHFVGYSLGGLVARAYIKKHPPENLGRVVTLGTPNKGSEFADMIGDLGVYQTLYGPAGQELTTTHDYDTLFGKPDYDLGCIAGDRTIDPVATLLIIDGDDDGKVSVESTKVQGMKDHIVLHATHTFMMSNEDVMRETRHFIENGKFEHKKEE